MNSHAGSARLWFLVEDLIIDHVDGGKISNISQEDVDLDHVVNATSGGVEDGAEIGQRLSLANRLADRRLWEQKCMAIFSVLKGL